ncbi:LysR substrate-binding domain-containing protein [Pseudomonas sp. SAS7]|uniref:LysR substrate-binding domain-containing protein n=1 Tax=Pseudomonas sp. SAS7 TaxID=3156487 RepID=UPI003F9C19D9
MCVMGRKQPFTIYSVRLTTGKRCVDNPQWLPVLRMGLWLTQRWKQRQYFFCQLLLSAAASGPGIALVQAQHAEDDLRSGRLVVAVDRPWPSRFAYYVVTRQESLSRPHVRAFINPQPHAQPSSLWVSS